MNKDEFKNKINQIHPSDKLKKETLEKMQKNNRLNKNWSKFLAICAMFLIVFAFTEVYVKDSKDGNHLEEQLPQIAEANMQIENDLQRFGSMQELINVLEKYNSRYNYTSTKQANAEDVSVSSIIREENSSFNTENLASDFSKTNVQVENVDEADIVKTDGNYIYYVSNNILYIIKADTMEIISKIKNEENKDLRFNFNNIFVKDNNLILLGVEYYNIIRNETKTVDASLDDGFTEDIAYVNSSEYTKAIVYDISDKSNPTVKREVKLDGYYSNSRMIGNSIYLVSTKNAYYRTGIKEEEILPKYFDSAIEEKNFSVPYDRIAYFENSQSSNFTLVAGFDITKNDPINLESFYGASNLIYASENNLYIIQTDYNFYGTFDSCKNKIYKFNLDNSKVVLKCQGEVVGNINNQFSIDEFEGNLRIATTVYEDKKEINKLFIFDEDLQKIGEISGFAENERIYAVRFMGKLGYIVTFKQVDPLFVIDLSDPRNPIIKGELKIPGYSSYLHFYDETHIIGIGHDVKSNGYGGVTNDGLKMSMFDVSDLENPKEIFNKKVSDYNAYTDLEYNHKVLFYSKSKNLIGFPYITYYKNTKNTFKIFKIDLENNEFVEYGKVEKSKPFSSYSQRAIYIEDILYILSGDEIVSYDLNTFEQKNILKFEDYPEIVQ